mmetsp:Transcript_7865/g.8340  ORF Transcript_7865/g.8340 Transcript_7865/m.8340 type:complete len:104 (-) Transcript_7865:211-522(-)
MGNQIAKDGLEDLGKSVVSASQNVQNIRHEHDGFEKIAGSVITASLILSCTYLVTTSQIGINKQIIAGKNDAGWMFYGLNGFIIVISLSFGAFVVVPRVLLQK